jgi:hypothetical protein
MSITVYPKRKGKRGQQDMAAFTKEMVAIIETITLRLPKKTRLTKAEIDKAIEEGIEDYNQGATRKEMR